MNDECLLRVKLWGRGGDLLIFHMRVFIEFFVACLSEHLAEDLTSVFVDQFDIIFLLRTSSLSLQIRDSKEHKEPLMTKLVVRHQVAIVYNLDRYYIVSLVHRR